MNEQLIAAYSSQADGLEGTIPGVDGLRKMALNGFGEQGFPTSKTEDWRYSDMRRFHKQHFELADKPAQADVPEALGETAARFVFINGRYDEEASDLGDVWQAISIRPLANHFMSNEYRVDEIVRGTDGVSLLNTAMMRDGLVLSIPAGIEIDDPIEIVH
ncbi:MAG: hypothetical protein AB3N28_15965, partial [Kordiimonas sp.]